VAKVQKLTFAPWWNFS